MQHLLSKSKKTSYFWGVQQVDSSRAKRLKSLPIVSVQLLSTSITLQRERHLQAKVTRFRRRGFTWYEWYGLILQAKQLYSAAQFITKDLILLMQSLSLSKRDGFFLFKMAQTNEEEFVISPHKINQCGAQVSRNGRSSLG